MHYYPSLIFFSFFKQNSLGVASNVPQVMRCELSLRVNEMSFTAPLLANEFMSRQGLAKSYRILAVGRSS